MPRISSSVIKRMPRYYRFLSELEKNGSVRVSSRELSERMGLTASQIRQDLNCFGGFGQQGYGYNVSQLKDEIGVILGLEENYKCIIIGAGNLGRTLASHMNFKKRGFRLSAIFDSNEAFAGQMVAGMPIRPVAGLDDFCRLEKPSIAILCVPKEAARSLGEQLARLGIKGIWNFSHYDFSGELDEVEVENVHLGDSLTTLSYRVKNHNRAIEDKSTD